MLFGQLRILADLFFKKNNGGCQFANQLLLFNLATADFLMGIYLIILGIHCALYNGVYGRYDLDWRSSLTCNILGILVVVSSETSVFTLLMLVAIRLFAVYKVRTDVE